MPASMHVGRYGSGQAVRRLEDDALLRGQGRYTDDLAVAHGQALAAAFVRSPYPHARIAAIDTEAARALPGVRMVVTGADLAAAGVKPLADASAGFKRADGSRAQTPPRRALAHETVRFVGEPVALVLADSLQQARDAAEAVMVDYQDLPHVVDLAQALADDAVRVVDGASDNIAAEMRHGQPEAAQAAFDAAAHVVRLDLRNQRLVALALEPRSLLIEPSARDGRLEVQMSTQMPSGIRNALKDALGIAPERIRVRVGDVGGGFGMKTGVYPEDIALAWAALQLGRSVRWVAERGEEFLASHHGRDVWTQAELALDASGRILALRVLGRANVGAYATGTGVAIQILIGPWVQTSVYDIGCIDLRYQALLTHTAPTGAYRGAGRPEAIYVIERLIDEAARRTGIDRIELRRRNMIRPEQMPYKNAMGQTYDSGKFEAVMNQALALADWGGFEQRWRQSRARGRWRGLGIATFLEWTGGNVFEERVTVCLRRADDGGPLVEVFSAVNAMGQGIATTLAQLVVDVFDLPIERVRVVLGDTERGNGFGSAGSRSLFTGGSSMRVGAERTLEQARLLAAQALEVAAPDLRYEQGRFLVPGTDVAIGLAELAARQPGSQIFVESTSAAGGPTWPNGCHIAEVELDPDTGTVDIVSYCSVNDVGRVVNPMIVVGQLDGGAVQGIGQALHEHMVYDAETGQPTSGSLMDYAAPRADQAPAFVTRMDESTPCLTNPLGVKGVGELGTIGATPCIVNAVADALARQGRGELAPRLQMPLSPARLWALLHGEAAG